MRGLIQRVSGASVKVGDESVGEIGRGALLLLGIEAEDNENKADKLLQKVLNYRIFPDSDNRMNLSLLNIQAGLLVVSQFTLVADTRRGLRPGFSGGAAPEKAERLYDYFVAQAESCLESVATGKFAADMQVSLCNDGPVTFLLEV